MAFSTVRCCRSNATLLAFILLAACAATSTTHATEVFTGKCVGVTDGDTISVMRDGRAVKVRLEGIDCPEPGQDFSSAAKKYVSALAYGKTIEVRVTGIDKYERVLAVVYADGTNVNLVLVQAGLAWHYKKYSSDAKLAAAEATAKQTHRLPPGSKMSLKNLFNRDHSREKGVQVSTRVSLTARGVAWVLQSG